MPISHNIIRFYESLKGTPVTFLESFSGKDFLEKPDCLSFNSITYNLSFKSYLFVFYTQTNNSQLSACYYKLDNLIFSCTLQNEILSKASKLNIEEFFYIRNLLKFH